MYAIHPTRHLMAMAATFFICLACRAEVAINEMGYHLDPSSDTGKEWIELYNPDSLPRNLSGYDLYPGRTPHFTFPAGFALGPGKFVLVHLRQDGGNTERDLYEGTAGVSSNMPNGHASVALFTSQNRDTIVDFMQYGSGVNTYEAAAADAGIWTRGLFADTAACGHSLGLASDGADSNRPADWREFPKPTPGYSNVPPMYDVELVSVAAQPLEIPSQQPFSIAAGVANAGQQTARLIGVTVFSDEDGDSARDDGERLWGQAGADSCPAALDVTVAMPGLAEGQYRFAVAAGCSLDSNSFNNYRDILLTADSPLVINEIMYDTVPGISEWVEVYNRSASPVDLCGWTLEDASTSPTAVTSRHDTLLPNSYALLAKDTTRLFASCLKIKVPSWPSLNNDGDAICLRDFRGAAIDRVQFSSSWGGGKGKSLERVNPGLASNQPTSWGGCVDAAGSTPGKQNSVYIEGPLDQGNLSIGPNPFSPDDDGWQDRALISFSFGWPRSVVTAKVFDRLGRLVATLAAQREFGPEGTLVWNGRDGSGGRCPIGIYIVLVEAKEAAGSGSFKKAKTVVVAGRL